MRVISLKKLRDFWNRPGNAAAEVPLRAWYRTVKQAEWENFADVKATYRTADQVKKSRKLVFDVGGNQFRLIAVIDYDRYKVFVRAVMDHKEYDKGNWRKDIFGEDWDKPAAKKGPEPSSRRPRRPKGR
jgi:mRNA interferase HigB